MLVEITHHYSIILPVMFSCTVALLIARLFCGQSVETFRLQNHGIHFDHFSRLEVNSLPVVDRSNPRLFVGMVSRAALMRHYMDELQKGA